MVKKETFLMFCVPHVKILCGYVSAETETESGYLSVVFVNKSTDTGAGFSFLIISYVFYVSELGIINLLTLNLEVYKFRGFMGFRDLCDLEAIGITKFLLRGYWCWSLLLVRWLNGEIPKSKLDSF